MAMFDPVYATEVINDILSRRGLEISIVLKDTSKPPSKVQDSFEKLPDTYGNNVNKAAP